MIYVPNLSNLRLRLSVKYGQGSILTNAGSRARSSSINCSLYSDSLCYDSGGYSLSVYGARPGLGPHSSAAGTAALIGPYRLNGEGKET